MKFPRNNKPLRTSWELAAVTSVLFLFAIFWVIHGVLALPPGVDIQLPESLSLTESAGPCVPIAIDASGQLYIENELVRDPEAPARLEKIFRQFREPVTLVIQADKRVLTDRLAEIWQMGWKAGFRQIRHAVRPPLLPRFGNPEP